MAVIHFLQVSVFRGFLTVGAFLTISIVVFSIVVFKRKQLLAIRL